MGVDKLRESNSSNRKGISRGRGGRVSGWGCGWGRDKGSWKPKGEGGGIDPGSLDGAVKQLLMSDKRQPLKNGTLIGRHARTLLSSGPRRALVCACVCRCVYFYFIFLKETKNLFNSLYL